MNKIIVTIFNDEKKAYEGAKALKELHGEGSLTLHATAIIGKDADGRVSVKHEEDPGPAGTAFGLAVGSLIGFLGGPVGLAVGATAGTVTGSLYDLTTLGVAEDFMAQVSQSLTPGKVAVAADVDEEWVTPLDSRMEALGGIVFRRARSEAVDAHFEREAAAEKAELDQLKAEYKQAVGDAKAKLKEKVDAADKAFDARRALLGKRIDAIEREGQTRIQALQQQAAKAHGEMKAKMEIRVADERVKNKARVEKLHQAWELIKEAASI